MLWLDSLLLLLRSKALLWQEMKSMFWGCFTGQPKNLVSLHFNVLKQLNFYDLQLMKSDLCALYS